MWNRLLQSFIYWLCRLFFSLFQLLFCFISCSFLSVKRSDTWWITQNLLSTKRQTQKWSIQQLQTEDTSFRELVETKSRAERRADLGSAWCVNRKLFAISKLMMSLWGSQLHAFFLKCPKFNLTPFNIVSSSRNNCGNIRTLLQQKLFKTLVRIKIIWAACDECWSLVSRSLLLTLSHELGLFHAARCLEAAGGDAGSAQTGRATYCCHGSGSVRRSYKHQHKDTKTRLRQKERKEERERNKELIFFKHFLLPEW